MKYIEELKKQFKKYKIDKSVNYMSWGKRATISYHYRLCDKFGKLIHHFEFVTPKTYEELEQAFIKAYIM